MRKNALHELTLIELTVARFLRTGCFLIKYSNDHTKYKYRQLKMFRDYLNKTLFL